MATDDQVRIALRLLAVIADVPAADGPKFGAWLMIATSQGALQAATLEGRLEDERAKLCDLLAKVRGTFTNWKPPTPADFDALDAAFGEDDP